MRDRPDRREFLKRSALAISAWHLGLVAPGLAAGRRSKLVEVRAPLALRELRLETASPDATLAFYEQALGLEVARTADGGTVTAGASRIVFRRAAEGREPYYHVAFNIPENKLQQAIRWARPRFELLDDPRNGEPGNPVVHFAHWNAHSVFFLDPADNLLELIARHDLDNATDGGFSPADLLNTSEIGIVVEEVVPTARLLEERLGVRWYSSPPNERFCAVGDTNGLFIVARRGRSSRFPEWSGFQGVFPTEVVVEGTAVAEAEIPGYPYRVRVSPG